LDNKCYFIKLIFSNFYIVGAIKDNNSKSNYFSMSVCPFVCPSVFKLQSLNLAIKFLNLISRKLPTRFLIFCLEAEIFEVKDAKWQKTHLFVCLLWFTRSPGGFGNFLWAKNYQLLNFVSACMMLMGMDLLIWLRWQKL